MGFTFVLHASLKPSWHQDECRFYTGIRVALNLSLNNFARHFLQWFFDSHFLTSVTLAGRLTLTLASRVLFGVGKCRSMHLDGTLDTRVTPQTY